MITRFVLRATRECWGATRMGQKSNIYKDMLEHKKWLLSTFKVWLPDIFWSYILKNWQVFKKRCVNGALKGSYNRKQNYCKFIKYNTCWQFFNFLICFFHFYSSFMDGVTWSSAVSQRSFKVFMFVHPSVTHVLQLASRTMESFKLSLDSVGLLISLDGPTINRFLKILYKIY